MITEVACDSKDLGLVKFLFPKYPVVTAISTVMRGIGVIFVSEKSLPPTPIHVVQVKRSSKYRVDTREGFLSFLENERGMKIPKQLTELDDESFWVQVKLFCVIGKYETSESGTKTSFDMFRNLFGPFEEKYRIYKNMNQPYQVVFSSMVTMMTKTMDSDNQTINPNYRKALMQNRPYLPLFRQRALQYALSDRTEWDFLNLLLSLNKR